jgi:hypothetical protein
MREELKYWGMAFLIVSIMVVIFREVPNHMILVWIVYHEFKSKH